ncbi:MAG: methylated-DNA--[protein]-cysteine S-methyltransferase [Clostridiaceae bacterium]|nr:methylated-DNA--[protein]-cysteine S-methyltransferase [Clostridiaceae bacterium]
MEQVCKNYFHSPVGTIEIICEDGAILSVQFAGDGVEPYRKSNPANSCNACGNACAAALECMRQLDEYFEGKRKEFSLNIKLRGTDFQKKVWTALLEIPYGHTSSYGEIAAKVGNKKAARAVGNANNRNPVSIIVPCHRVIGSDGSLSGYGGGSWRKKWLLEHERKNM